jgi:hypothetical protein
LEGDLDSGILTISIAAGNDNHSNAVLDPVIVSKVEFEFDIQKKSARIVPRLPRSSSFCTRNLSPFGVLTPRDDGIAYNKALYHLCCRSGQNRGNGVAWKYCQLLSV